MGDVVLFVDDLQSSCAVSHCRICHEAEFESCKSLEAPCACSGTVKFAHRDCIQRWCNEKGNTTCEICLQKYESGYTATSKKCQQMEMDAMTIRESLEIPRRGYEPEIQGMVTVDEAAYSDIEWTSAADRSASYCRSLAIIFTALLLLKHFCATLTGGTQDYPFTLVTILVLRTSGILLPMYIVFRTIAAFQKCIRTRYQGLDENDTSTNIQGDENEEQHLV
ncbi:E3 ubiquitin-protein ligase MARCHF8 isoform X2 [Manihot esculenta]|uniref:RING-CH-type domain-containing protein n=1 Tax=Manihot esculenta TaxID=3983 RepID=A0A2C9VS01_MANES|nr:E3 ubiquitin-protein ligase MARCHF8 isoform X2 [Manihot esculenta]OAY48751.1 hypothetical protein MANES_05G002900v8 [Manihot esculenta]